MNQVWLEPGSNVCTGYKGALGGKETFLGLWHPGTNRFSGDLPLSLGPELAFSASVQSSDTHQAGVALKSKGQQTHSVTTVSPGLRGEGDGRMGGCQSPTVPRGW